MNRARFLLLAGVLAVLSVGPVVTYAGFHAASVQSCRARNGLRDQLLGYIDGQIGRQEKGVRATLSSPTASKDQKATAVGNLNAARDQQRQLHRSLAPESC